MFPAVDPIPLPAPVWLFKALHDLTLSLHFLAAQMLLGGLAIGVWAAWRSGRGGPAAGERRNLAAALARRLPIVMTYVINFGVPPLLFAQVLYGRAFYTSSVLIGGYWISVIGLLMLCYWLLYRFSAGLEQGRAAWGTGLLSLLTAAAVARIYSTNMTLMLRPEAWPAMYAADPAGLSLPPHDPSLLPRWLFMMTGGLTVGGLWLLWLSGRSSFAEASRAALARRGGILAAAGALAQAGLGVWVVQVQPAAVREGLGERLPYAGAGVVWLLALGGAAALGAWCYARRPVSRAPGWAAAVLAFAGSLSMVVVRDGIRDLTLAGKGFDVWARETAINWSVLAVFFIAFATGLALLGWLISVMRRAAPVKEEAA